MAAAPSARVEIILVSVSPDNWRDCVSLEVTQAQSDFVSPVSRYLAMCAYGDTPWQPLAVESVPSNEAARRLYTALGFVETDEREDEELVARLQF